jgi:diadenosine tetraphosphatase ApaH/serine/threonine PP2A family protein phosphatase
MGGAAVLLALFADIHANRQAFTACLTKAREQGAERFILLGDYVGYGADPDWAVAAVSDLVADGAVAILGNHDSAIGNPRMQMNAEAEAAIEWTRGKLDQGQRKFLAELPMRHEEHSLLFVHSEATRPDAWIYVTDSAIASRSMQAVSAHVTFCGHVHKPALYSLSVTGKMTTFVPTDGIPVHLLPGRQWHAVLGSVGQPRDGNPAAAYALYDTVKHELTYCRVPYDVDEAARRIRDNGLPVSLADRLLVGR